jgi:hypothetical protein
VTKNIHSGDGVRDATSPDFSAGFPLINTTERMTRGATMTQKFLSPEDLITSAEAATEQGFGYQQQIKLLKSGKLNAYHPPIVYPTTSNKNCVPRGLPAPPQRYNKETDDEIQELDIRSVKELFFEWNEIKVLIPEIKVKRSPAVKDSKNKQHQEASGQPRRTNTRRQVYKAAASQAETVIQDLIHDNILATTRAEKLAQLKENKPFQKIVGVLPQV